MFSVDLTRMTICRLLSMEGKDGEGEEERRRDDGWDEEDEKKEYKVWMWYEVERENQA
jgi:hypothetical protein